MTRRVFLLNGLAILAVVCGHAQGWGHTAMIWWADRYRPVSVPNYDYVGTMPYYFLIAVRCLAAFTVPAFLFVSGFFVAYGARGKQSTLSWKAVTARLRSLLVPYLIWSVVIFIGDALQGVTYAPLEYVQRLALGRADGIFYFVIVLCQLYLLSPLIVPVARSRPRLLLIGSALLQLGTVGLRYLTVFGVEIPALHATTDLLFPMYAFFFASGVVSGFYLQPLKQWLITARWALLVALVVLGTLNVLESEVVYRLTELRRGGGPTTFPATLYATAVIFCFLSFYELPVPFSKAIQRLGGKSYGVYLTHRKVLEFVARATQKFVPWVLANQALFQLVLIVPGVLGPLLLMAVVSKSPIRRFHRYLFG